MPMMFINLPVENVQLSREFFTALSMDINPDFSNDHTVCVEIDENILIMMLATENFKGFTEKYLIDPKEEIQTLLCFTRNSREDVDTLVDKAIAAGAKESRPAQDVPETLYGRSFDDLDGHTWEVIWLAGAEDPV